jgi:hypothetical protein
MRTWYARSARDAERKMQSGHYDHVYVAWERRPEVAVPGWYCHGMPYPRDGVPCALYARAA